MSRNNQALFAALLMAVPFFCHASTGDQGMQVMQDILDAFASNSNRWVGVMQSAAWKVFGALATVELFLKGKKLVMDPDSGPGTIIGTLVSLALVWGFFGWVIANPDLVLGGIVRGFQKLGGDASGLGFLNPSEMVVAGINLAQKISDNVSAVTAVTNPIIGFTSSLTMILVVLSFAVLGFQEFAAQLHFYLLMAVAPILLAGGALSFTRDWAVKQLQGAVSTGVSILVIYLVAGVVVSFIPNFQAAVDNGGITNMTPLLVMCAAAILIFFLAWKAPTIASSIMSGTTSVNTSDMASFGMTMAAAGAAVAAGAVGAAQAGMAGVKGAAGLAGQGADLARNMLGGGSMREASGGGSGAGMNHDSLGGMPSASFSPSQSSKEQSNSDWLASGGHRASGDASSASIGGGNGKSYSSSQQPDTRSGVEKALDRFKGVAQSAQHRAQTGKDWVPDAQNNSTLHIDHKE